MLLVDESKPWSDGRTFAVGAIQADSEVLRVVSLGVYGKPIGMANVWRDSYRIFCEIDFVDPDFNYDPTKHFIGFYLSELEFDIKQDRLHIQSGKLRNLFVY